MNYDIRQAVTPFVVAILTTGLAMAPASIFPRTSFAQSEGKNKVLRHAVFFKFKDDASEDDVAKIVEAFRALPAKIQDIQAFELGEVLPNSTRNDGLTHCFLLTFKDEAGRAAYLPHPDHKEFGGVLRPHLDRVFVIDYWGQPQKSRPKKALQHFVFFKFKDGVADEAKRVVEEGLAALPAKIDTIKGFEWGTNNSPEKHDQGYTHCFVFTFDSEAGLKEYMDHPAHLEVVQDLRPKMESIRAIDFFSEEVPAGKNR